MAKTPSKTTAAPVADIDACQRRIDELHPAQLTVVRMVAEWERPADIRAAVTDALKDGTISEPWIRKVCSPACRPAWARPIIDQLRAEFLAARDAIPCRHSAWRMRELQRIIETSGDDRTKLAAIKEAFEQSGDKVDRVADVSEQEALEQIVDQLQAATDGRD